MKTNRIDSLDIARPLMMLGVVLIHSSMIMELPTEMNGSTAERLMIFFSQDLSGGCVPAFYIISGFLFFSSKKHFDQASYIAKLKRRFRSLIIPYLLWNLIASAIFLFKTIALGYDGMGIVNNGSVNFLRFLEGFWATADGYPFDFPMWFIRDLIIMIIVSPVFYILARRTWATVLTIVAAISFAFPVVGTPYFLLGAWIAIHHKTISTRLLAIGSCLLLTCVLLNLWGNEMNHIALDICKFARNIGVTSGAVLFGRYACRHGITASSNLQEMVFFVYAFHGVYCTLLRKSILSIVGFKDSLNILSAYFLTFAILIVVSALCYVILRHIVPHLISVLCGSRG